MAGDIIAAKCKVPHLYRFELMGTPEDVTRVQKGLEEFWTRLSQTQK
jgi:protein involved in ribonucleotide reduction